ncbi:hypothetical protein Bca4012_025423 [Brassica carinata]
MLLLRWRRVIQWVASYTTDLPSGAAVSRMKERCEGSTERVSFSGFRFRCVVRLHVLGLLLYFWIFTLLIHSQVISSVYLLLLHRFCILLSFAVRGSHHLSSSYVGS